MYRPFPGGKGKTAPYLSTHVRVPNPIKPLVELLINEFKRWAELKGVELAIRILEPPICRAMKIPMTSEEERKKRAIAILKESLTYKPNAGGKIKASIREAIALLEEAN
jgi:hypothetical protein